jgi:hypothetical protein
MNNTDTLASNVQFSVVLANKPGSLGRVVQHLADRKVNLLAVSMMDSTEHGVLRLVAEEPDLARKSLSEVDESHTETAVLTSTMPNRPGALAELVERLDQEHIQVLYAYGTGGARNGKGLGVFKVSNPNKAIQVLSERRPRRRTPVTAIRTMGKGART